MKILLARHGETPWNAEGRYQGQEDIALSEVGIGQATALGERLRDLPIQRAIASPLSRARRTAELALGAERAGQLMFDGGLKEIAHGEWEGLLASEIDERDGERLRAWPAFARACAGLGADDTLLVVAHDAVNRVLLCRILGIPLSKLWGFRQAPTTINLLEGASVDALEVVRLNDCSHHTALFGEAKHRAL